MEGDGQVGAAGDFAATTTREAQLRALSGIGWMIEPGRTRGLSSTEAFEGLSPGGCMYPGLPELPGELGSMPSLFRRMPAGVVRARSDLITTEIVFPSGTRFVEAGEDDIWKNGCTRARARYA